MKQVLKAADYPRMPWKNGAGTTLEIARDQGDGLEGFGWRLSIADVGSDGGFSAFNGYRRIITVLEGQGMELSVDGAASGPLRPFEPFVFSGDSAVECRLLGGAIRDFNLIWSPERYAARLQWGQGRQAFHSGAQTVVVFSASERVTCAGEVLGLQDCLVLEGVEAVEVDGARWCLIELTRLV